MADADFTSTSKVHTCSERDLKPGLNGITLPFRSISSFFNGIHGFLMKSGLLRREMEDHRHRG